MPKREIRDVVKVRKTLTTKVERKEVPSQSFREPKEGKSKYSLWILAVFAIIFLFFAVSFFTSKATVTVTPKNKAVTLAETYAAQKGKGELPFDVVILSGDVSKEKEASTEREFKEKASGTVVLYNAYNSSEQVLKEETRLEGSNGKIYKLVSKVTIPAMRGTTIGSVETKIAGDLPGEAYNSAPLDFKILGFKGTPKYEKIYGRSKGDITGGLVGKHFELTEEEKNLAKEEINKELEEKLFQKAHGQIPPGFVLLRRAHTIQQDETVFQGGREGTQNVTVTAKGTFTGFLFDEKKLTTNIASSVVENYDNSPLVIQDLHNLEFTLKSTNDSPELNDIRFELKGPIKLVWNVDDSSLSAKLVGKSKKGFGEILKQYPSIDSALLSLRPFWLRSFPDEKEKIKVKVEEI